LANSKTMEAVNSDADFLTRRGGGRGPDLTLARKKHGNSDAHSVRIATFNCENLFSRAKILNMDAAPEEAAEAAEISKAAQQLKKIFMKPTYTAADKTKILDLMLARMFGRLHGGLR
jgi:hypothetical protein